MLAQSDKSHPAGGHASAVAARPARDVRLDFFRGVGMFIIFVAHVPFDPIAQIIPARFGFSDATEMFVFCSGMASAIAFGKLYDRTTFALATARVVQRVWQVYWAHVGIFFTTFAVMVAADRLAGPNFHVLEMSSFQYFLSKDVGAAILGFMTLSFQPQFFDILPMYLVILAMMPVVMALSRVDRGAVAVFVVGTWLIGTTGYLELQGDPWTGDHWYFHPLAWQLVFFTGFAFMRGWLPTPGYDRRLLWLAVAVLVASVPFSWWILLDRYEALSDVRDALAPLTDKTRLGLFRYVHFLALAYVAYLAAGPAGVRLKGRAVAVITRVGQQTLAVFMTGVLLAQVAAVVLSVWGDSLLMQTVVNGSGFAILIAVAYLTRWFKSTPWQAHAHIRMPDVVAGGAAAAHAGGHGASEVATASRSPAVSQPVGTVAAE